MPTIRISKETAKAINELGGTFDKPDDVVQRLITEAGHETLLDTVEDPYQSTKDETTNQGTRSDWINSWLDEFEQKLSDKGADFYRVPGRGGADFKINEEYIGKVRTAKAWNRDDERIWLRFEDEIKWAEDSSEMEAVAIVLDVYDRSPSFTDQDHFFVLDQGMLSSETSSAGNRELNVHSPGQYEPPFDLYADDWESWY